MVDNIDQAISLDTTTTQTPISLDTGSVNDYTLSPELVAQRVAKFSYAMANTPAYKPENEVLTALQNQGESGLREESASTINTDLLNKRTDLLSKTIANKQGPITSDDMKNIDTASGFNFPYAYPRDPSSILEQNYAHQYISELDTFAQKISDNNFWNYGQLVARNDIEAAKIFGDVVTAKNQYLITKIEDGQSKIAGQTSIGYGADFAKSAFPIMNPYYEAKLRSNVPGVGFFEGGLLGQNLQAQSDKLHSLPFDQFTKVVNDVYDKLSKDNPQIAVAWLQAMQGQSAFDKNLNNINTVGHMFDVPIVFQIGKLGFSRLGLVSQVRTGMTTALKAVSTPETTIADIKTSVGDAAAGGRANANNVLTGKIVGSLSPVEEASRTLPSNMNLFKTEIQNATDLSQTHQNILLADTDGIVTDGLKVLSETLRPTRVDLEHQTGAVLDAIDNAMIRKYAGDNNNILRTSDPIRDPYSTTSYKTLWLGNDGGTFFESLDQATDRIIHKGFRVTYTPEQLADLDAKIATVKSQLGLSPGKELEDLVKKQKELGRVGDNLVSKMEGIREQQGAHSPAYADVAAEYESHKGAVTALNRRVFALRKDALESGPSMHEDVHGINYYDTLPDTLKSLEQKRVSVTRPGGATIQQQGLSFYGEFNAPVKETDRLVGDLVFSPDNPLQVSPNSWTRFIPYFNHVRTAEDTFSVEARGQRKVATYPQGNFLKMLQKDGQILQDFFHGKETHDPVTGEPNPFYKRGVPGVRSIMNRQRTKQFFEVLDYSQKEFDPVTKVPGWWMTPSELNHHYQTVYHRPATFPEVRAYEAAKRWDEMQRWFTQVMTYRDQAMRGNQTHVVITRAADGTEIRSPEFVGAISDKFPSSRGTILVVGDKIGTSFVSEFPENASKSSVKDLGRTSLKQKEEWADQVRSGTHRLIRLDRPEDMPFKGFGVKDDESLIHFVLAPNIETSALKWDSIPRTGGGRFVYDYTHYIKTPRMKYETVGGSKHAIYLDDITVAPIGYKSLGEDVVKKANVVRRLIKAGDEEGAKASYINNGLEGAFEPWGKFRAKYERFKDAEGNWHDAMYSKEEDFHVVPRNKKVIDLGTGFENKYGPKGPLELRNQWRNGITENNPARNFQVQFTQERDATTLEAITDIGTKGNPVYARTPAQKIDPLTMLNRGMRSTVNSLFMDDYKAYAVNNFLREVSGKLKLNDSEVWSSPYAVFKTLTKDDFRSAVPKSEVLKYMANHYKIEQLVGTPTVLDSFVHEIAQNLADATYRTLGPTAASHVVPAWLLPKLRDPFAYIRSVTFNAYLGLFSVPQLFVQSMNYVNMFAISPRHAIIGTYGAFLHHISSFTEHPETLQMLDKLATQMRIPGLPSFKPGEFLEIRNEFKNSGFKYVGAEHGMIDNMYRNNIIKRGSDTFLEWGRKPFQLGEYNSRVGAYYIAMKEFRTTNPTGRLSVADRTSILDRADFLYGNMSVASHSVANSGILSTATQFYMYTARLAEIFWSGSRLGGTLAERNLARARLMAVNGAMFGVPMAAGISGLPVADWLRQELQDNGYFGKTPPYVVGKNFVESLINEGVLAGGIAAVTGNWYNVGPREGLQGLTPMKDLLTKDTSFWKIAGGASASLTMNTFNNGVYPLMFQLYHDGFKNTKLEDIVDVAKEAQIVNSGWSFWSAWGSGKWINKNADYISDTSKANAAFMFLTGLRESGQQDIWGKEQTIQSRDSFQKWAMKQFSMNMNRGMIASANGDQEQALAFRSKAIAYLANSDFPPEKLGQAIIRAFKGAENLIDRVDKEFYILKAPVKQRDALKKAFEYIRQHRGQ